MSVHNPFQAFGIVDPAGGTGPDFLKLMPERREPSPPFSETTVSRMVPVERDRMVFAAMPSARFYNPMEMIHGAAKERCFIPASVSPTRKEHCLFI